MMSYRKELESKLEQDYSKTPKKIWNQNDVELIWDETQKIYIGKDENGIEWIESLQHTKIPIFTIHCNIPKRKGNVEVPCSAPNFCTILDDGKEFECRVCDSKNKIKLLVPKDSRAFDILQKLKE